MVYKYIVTGKDDRNIYLRTDYLRKAMKEAKKHGKAWIRVYKKYLGGYVVLRKLLDGKVIYG